MTSTANRAARRRAAVAAAVETADGHAPTKSAAGPAGSPRSSLAVHLLPLAGPDPRPARSRRSAPRRRRQQHRLVDGVRPSVHRDLDARATTTRCCSGSAAWDAVHQQLRDRPAGDVHPDPDRGVRGLRVHVHGVPRPGRPVPPHRQPAGRAATTWRFVPLLKLYGNVGLNGTFPRSGWRTSGSACRWRSTSCATTWRPCPRRDRVGEDRRRAATTRRSGGSSCRCRCPRWRRSRSSSSSGSGTTCWWRWSSSDRARTSR